MLPPMTGPTDDARRTRRRGLLLLLVVLLGVLGVADGTYLSLVHIDYELGTPSELADVCSKLAPRGCAVTTGRFGSLMGIPVALWGLGGAAATTIVAGVAWFHRARSHDAWRNVVLALAAASVLASIVMALLSALEGSYCPFCVMWYGLNLGMGVAAWFARGEHQDASLDGTLRDVLGVPGLVAALAFGASVLIGHSFYASRYAETRAKLQMVVEAVVRHKLTEPTVEIDLRDLPTRGPEDATLTIVEVADFECPFCRRLWQGIHDYTEHATPSVRVAFIHYPLDGTCNPGLEPIHPHACLAAKASECARREDKFWEYGDLLFARQPALARENLLDYAAELGLDQSAFAACLDNPVVLLEVRRSIARAILLGVRAPPTFFVNGYKWEGALPKTWLPLVLDELARATSGENGQGAVERQP